MDEIFDAISYSKGASVIRMLHNYIGDEVRVTLLASFRETLSVNLSDRWSMSLPQEDVWKDMLLICLLC